MLTPPADSGGLNAVQQDPFSLPDIELPLPQGRFVPLMYFGGIVVVVLFGLVAVLPMVVDRASGEGDLEIDLLASQAWEDAQWRDAVEAAAVPFGADLLVTSNWPDATAWIGADSVGTVPLLLADLQAGIHHVRIVSRGRTVLDSSVVLTDGSFARLHAERPQVRRAAPVGPSLEEVSRAAWRGQAAPPRTATPRVGWGPPQTNRADDGPAPATRPTGRVAW